MEMKYWLIKEQNPGFLVTIATRFLSKLKMDNGGTRPNKESFDHICKVKNGTNNNSQTSIYPVWRRDPIWAHCRVLRLENQIVIWRRQTGFTGMRRSGKGV